MKLTCSLLAVLIGAGLVAGNQDGVKSERPLDKDFLIKVATANNAEIQTSSLAGTRSNSSDVKDFAAMIVKDHKEAGNKLAELLKGRNLAIAAGFDKETKDEVARLSGLKGDEFDQAFLVCTTKAHQDAIALFENQLKNGQEADIRAYAKEILPHLREHLAKAKELTKATKK